MKQLRNGTFETNSSSAHSCILINDNEYTTDEEIENYIKNNIPKDLYKLDGSFLFPVPKNLNGEYGIEEYYSFGQDFAIYDKWFEKLAYILASVRWSTTFSFSDIVMTLKRKMNCYGIIEHAMLKNECSRCCGNTLIYYSNEIYDSLGDIDHQSTDTVDGITIAIKTKYPEKSIQDILYEIIFSNKYAIITDNDGDFFINELLTEGLIDKNILTHILHFRYDDSWHIAKSEFISIDDEIKNSENEDDE